MGDLHGSYKGIYGSPLKRALKFCSAVLSQAAACERLPVLPIFTFALINGSMGLFDG